MAGNDNHQTSASQTASDIGTMYRFQSQGSSTHTFTLATAGHHAIGANSTQDQINNQDSASMSLWSSQTTSAWGAFYYDDVRFTASQLYTSSLSQVGAGADAVASTLDASTSIAQAGDGADLGATNAFGTCTQSLSAAVVTRAVTTPIGAGASRTAGTTDHLSQNAFDIFYQPEAGTPKFTHSTTAANNQITLTQAETVTRDLAGTFTEFSWRLQCSRPEPGRTRPTAPLPASPTTGPPSRSSGSGCRARLWFRINNRNWCNNRTTGRA